jgi:hypothetical protein
LRPWWRCTCASTAKAGWSAPGHSSLWCWLTGPLTGSDVRFPGIREDRPSFSHVVEGRFQGGIQSRVEGAANGVADSQVAADHCHTHLVRHAPAIARRYGPAAGGLATW